MARSRAAASIALTAGVAVATLAVMGAILAGPTLADCAGDSLFACLRDRAVAPAEPPRPAGWIEAVATEYAPPPPAAATLTAPAGQLAAAVATPADAAPVIPAMLAAPGGQLTAAVTPPPAAPAAAIVLEPAGGVAAIGATGGEGTPLATAALAAPTGTLSAGTSPALSPVAAAAALTAPEKTISSPVDLPKIEAQVIPPPPRYDPAFPNVVVLPSPDSGADSSIRTLTVR